MKRHDGFTLIEMMVTIAIMAIIAAIAMPSMQSLIIANRLAAQTNELLADLALARSEAAKTGGSVTVCISTDGLTCTGGTNWALGRIAFTDDAPYGSREGSDTIVRKSPAIVDGNTFISSWATGHIRYLGTGLSNLTNTTNTLTLCHSGSSSKVVRVSITGRAFLDAAASSNCP